MSALVTLTCCDCQHSREVYRSQVGTRYGVGGNLYRCQTCFQKARREGVVPPGRKPLGRSLTCNSCGATKAASKDAVENVSKIYHCRACYLRLRTSGALPQGGPCQVVSVTCPECGWARNMKPSQAARLSGLCTSCARKGHRGGMWAGGSVVVTCSCGTQQTYNQAAAGGLQQPYKCCHCSTPSGPANHAWNGGTSFGLYPVGWTSKLRETIRVRDKHTCVLCNSVGSSRQMDVHHIDYDKNNLSHSNLVTLCKKCHPKTNFNRSYWAALLAPKVAA